jgi:uncharacterized protein
MLLVKTFIQSSPNKGIGLFTLELISKGTKYWVRNEIFDRVFSENDLQLFSEINVNYIKRYGFLEISGNWYLCGDNARFTNHSNNSNSKNYFDEGGLILYTIAEKEILPGEEILCDYREICQECKKQMNFVIY